MWKQAVVALHVAPEAAAPPVPLESVRAVAGRGLEGDRYFAGSGTYSNRPEPARECTLIEQEALEALAREYGLALDPGQSRRNITTRGVPLNHLVGRRFRVGEALLEGIRLCEPCNHLAKLLNSEKARAGLVHRGGLRARVLEDGSIRVGDGLELA